MGACSIFFRTSVAKDLAHVPTADLRPIMEQIAALAEVERVDGTHLRLALMPAGGRRETRDLAAREATDFSV